MRGKEISELESLVIDAIVCGKRNVEEIADAISVPENVVKATINRLKEKGLIEDYFTLTEKAHRYTDRKFEKEEIVKIVELLIFIVGLLLIIHLILWWFG